jgi:hypothetical protein
MSVKLFCLSGTGASGKTSIINHLTPFLKEAEVVFFPSVVRGFYVSHGISNEEEFYKLSKIERKAFQIDLLSYYITSLESKLHETKALGLKGVIMDRAAYDHLGYTLCGCMEDMTAKDYEWVMGLVAHFENLNPLVMYLPFPTPWGYEAGADGFRYRAPAKDALVDATIVRYLMDYKKRKTVPCWTPNGKSLPVEVRADIVTAYMKQELGIPLVGALTAREVLLSAAPGLHKHREMEAEVPCVIREEWIAKVGYSDHVRHLPKRCFYNNTMYYASQQDWIEHSC